MWISSFLHAKTMFSWNVIENNISNSESQQDYFIANVNSKKCLLLLFRTLDIILDKRRKSESNK